MQKKYIFPLSILFLLSRIPFINTSPLFFDSGEYSNLFHKSSLAQALTTGHFPLHEGYVLLGWMGVHIFHSLTLVLLVQVLLSLLTVACFYQICSFLGNTRIALFASILISVVPLFWITNVTIMMENAYVFLFFLAVALLMKFLETKRTWLFHLSAVTLVIACISHLLVVFWLPFVGVLLFLKQKQWLSRYGMYFVAYFVIASFLNAFFISRIMHMPVLRVLYYLYISKTSEFAAIPHSLKGLLIIIRNLLVPLAANGTIGLIMLAGISLVCMFQNQKKQFFLVLSWVLPILMVNQIWDSLLPGRHALIGMFGMAYAVAYLLEKKRMLQTITLIYLLTAAIPAVVLLRFPAPYLVEARAVRNLPKNSVLIESHFARPQMQDAYTGQLISVNEPGWGATRIKKVIDTALTEQKPVFITAAAISEPYGLYAGPYVHSLTLSYANPYTLTSVLPAYTLKQEFVENKQDNLILYQIVQRNRSPYPNVTKLIRSRRRLDYADVLSVPIRFFLSH